MNEECPICLDACSKNKDTFVMPCCQKKYHIACLEKWNSSCPTCRREAWVIDVPEEEEEKQCKCECVCRRVYVVIIMCSCVFIFAGVISWLIIIKKPDSLLASPPPPM